MPFDFWLYMQHLCPFDCSLLFPNDWEVTISSILWIPAWAGSAESLATVTVIVYFNRQTALLQVKRNFVRMPINVHKWILNAVKYFRKEME